MTRKLLRKPAVAERYGNIDPRTIDRWLAGPALDFPQPIRINRQPYWDESDLTRWERSRAAPRSKREAESAA